MSNYKEILGIISASLQITSYIIYFRGVFQGKTKPHAFTWFVWGVINIIAFAAILKAGAGPGAWSIGVNILACLSLATVGYIQNVIKYDLFDWVALAGGILGAILWAITKNPLTAVLLVVLSDATACIPTLRKAYRLPFEENPVSFSIGIINYGIAIFALQTLTLTTWIYPAQIILSDIAIVLVILVRRRQLR